MHIELTELLRRESAPPPPAATALALRALRHVGFLGHAHDRLSILIFHRVLPAPDPLFPDEVDARRFDQLLALLKTCFNIVPLSEGVRGLKSGKLPPRAACITFDDGYADNAEIALPLLQKHGVKATFFVATGFLDGGRMFNDSVIETVRRAPDALDLRPLGLGELDLSTVEQRRAAIPQLLGALKYLPLLGSLPELDSMAVVTLIGALEEHFGIMVDDDDISASTFATLGSLARLRGRARRKLAPPVTRAPTRSSSTPPDGQRFCLFHPPWARAAARWSTVHPFAEEMNRSRRMAALPRARWPRRVIGVLLLDLHGCGDSAAISATPLGRLAARHRRGRAWIEQRLGCTAGLWGLRVGALLALDHAQRPPCRRRACCCGNRSPTAPAT
jgi:hypothetical protein